MRAGGGRLGAGEDLQERRLAGAVLAEQAEHLAGPHVERHVVERGDADEALAEALDFEQRPRGAAGAAVLRPRG